MEARVRPPSELDVQNSSRLDAYTTSTTQPVGDIRSLQQEPSSHPLDGTYVVHAPVFIEADQIDPNDKMQNIYTKFSIDVDHLRLHRIPHERVNKVPRMRVRYTCHRCRTSFGYDRECVGCRHRRCTRCDRYPPRKIQQERVERATTQDAQTRATQSEVTAQQEDDSTKELYCNCHECQTGIDIGIDECPNCHHKVCDRCVSEFAAIRQPAPLSHQEQQQAESIRPNTSPPRESRPQKDPKLEDIIEQRSTKNGPS